MKCARKGKNNGAWKGGKQQEFKDRKEYWLGDEPRTDYTR
jgi:hypothetical protein